MGDAFADWQQEATAEEVTVQVCLNRRLYRDFYEVASELEAVRIAHPAGGDGTLDGAQTPAEVEEIAQRVADLEEQVRAAERPMVFRCRPFGEWRKLGDRYPATEEQRKANRLADVDEVLFWPAAVAESCVNFDLKVDAHTEGGKTRYPRAEWLREFLPRDKWGEIVDAVRQANVGGSEIPKSVSSIVAQLRSGLSSITALPEVSPSPSSEAGSPSEDAPADG